MKYMGSKNRIAKHILPIMLANRKEGQYWVEPFVGGANIIDKISGNRIGADNNKYLIALFRSLFNDVVYPVEIGKSLYALARDVYNGKETRIEHTMNMTDDLVGWIGFMASANGRFFEGGYSGKSNTKIGTVRDYIAESIRGIEKQKNNLIGIEFICSDYMNLAIPENSIIYCDIPYKGTKQYSTSKNFNTNEFWQWCRDKEAEGHTVYISEYNAPEDFECIWSKEIKSSLSANGKIGGNKNSTERLFEYCG